MASTEKYDLLLVVDATASMSSYLTSLQTSLPKIISISALTSCFSRIGLLAYRDYCDGQDLLEWSGWLEAGMEPGPDLISKASFLQPQGGGDIPEATKTGLAKAYEVMRPDATTIIILYTDAPPHLLSNPGASCGNHKKETKALREEGAFGEYGSLFVDWVEGCRTLCSGPKKAKAFCFLSPHMSLRHLGHYAYLSARTQGACFRLYDSRPLTVSQMTVEILLAWMGVEKSGASTGTEKLPASISQYSDLTGIDKVENEKDPSGIKYFPTAGEDRGDRYRIECIIEEKQVTHQLLKDHLHKKKTPMQDFAKRYGADASYRKIVVEQLGRIIEEDVSAISLNPIFGSLWRAVCNDRENEARDGLISAFGLKVEQIKNTDEKARMKVWLDESYDYSAEVLETIASVPVDQRYPCVFLDPTLTFSQDKKDQGRGYETEDDRPITSFTRDELLEIGRSCDYKILRRLGRVLTRLTFVTNAEELPVHISKTTDEELPKIPMALASQAYGCKFWGLLLHLVVPGTKISRRHAALLAALAIRMGVQPLLQSAGQEMLFWQKRWNDIEIPETWNVNCLSLLLDADKSNRTRIRDSETAAHEGTSLLTDEDRTLFDRLVSYKMLELNMKTTLTAKIGWTPEKTSIPIGPMAVCKSCEYPRSVTIMGKGGICGHCMGGDWKSEKERTDWINYRVSKTDTEDVEATWVECSLRTCRAQYVVYHAEALNVRPKCYFCRLQGSLTQDDRTPFSAPCLECTQCLNRVIWPHEYRPKNLDEAAFKCVACSHGRKTIVDVETTAAATSEENSRKWLLTIEEGKIKEPFNGRSLFHTISTAGTEGFCDKVILFPATHDLILTLRGKRIRNALEGDILSGENQSLISELQSWVSRRRTEGGTCDLCFSTIRKTDALPACGRRFCHQKICQGCLKGWYGLNASGRLINTAALHCPFCRRPPTAKTLAGYGMGVHAVGNLADAVAQSGTWIYAWCQTCGMAKQYMERVCARGAPEDVSGWVCEECTVSVVGDEVKSIRNCPGCEVPTQKTGGCDHIECPNCGNHWCFFCGGAFGEDEIYPHMNQEHGGYYGGGDVYEYVEEEEFVDLFD